MDLFQGRRKIKKEQTSKKKPDGYKMLFSRRLLDILNNIDDDISYQLRSLMKNQKEFDITCVDILDENNISYTPAKIVKIVGERDSWKKSRNPYKIGRFVRKVLGKDDPNEIERFVNRYKAELLMIDNFDNFDIVEGDEIVKYYNGKTYSEGQGPLNKSCMRHNHCEPFFDFYKYNNDKVKMVVLYNNKKEKLILGRALLWYVDEPEMLLMDRVYTTKDTYVNMFIKYAKNNGWAYKKSQGFDEPYIIDKDGNQGSPKCKVYINSGKYKYYPYLDTFYFYDSVNGYLTNSKKEYKLNKNIIKLRSTDGRDQGNTNFVYDKYNNDFVRVSDTEYCSIGDSRVLRNDIININGNYSLPTMVRYSEYDNKLYTKDNSVWSNTHRTYIPTEKSFKVYLNEDMSSFDYIHSDFNGEKYEYINNKNSYFLKELLIKGIDKRYHLKSEYDEEKIKKRMESNVKGVEDWDNIFDEFIKTLEKKEIRYKNYGTFK